MLKLTLIARLADKLVLAVDDKESEVNEPTFHSSTSSSNNNKNKLFEESDSGLDQYKKQRNKILDQISLFNQHPPEKLSIDSGPMVFHILISDGIVYMTLCEKSYSTQLAYAFLEELKKEFNNLYLSEAHKVERAFAFIKFETFIQKTRRVYTDSRTKSNIQVLKDELNDVQQIIRKNINDVIGRGEQLEQMTNMSSEILDGAKKFKKGAVELNNMKFWKKYGYLIAIPVFILLLIIIRYLVF
ncbi:hypothetical protein ABK040_008612 [Willaertia magna]